MRSHLIAIALVLSACGGTDAPPTTGATSAPAATTTTADAPADPDRVDTGDLVDPVVRTASLDGERLLVALASTPVQRSQGLRGVLDLGDLDGMVFWWGGAETTSSFTMADTLIDLDIAWFDLDGHVVSTSVMTPCRDADPCPSYRASGRYAMALERPAGALPEVTPGSRLVVDDLP